MRVPPARSARCIGETGEDITYEDAATGLTCDPTGCAPEGTCRLTGGGCLNEEGAPRGSRQSTFGGNASPLLDGGGPSGNSGEHVYRDARTILFNWHSWDAHVIGCSVVPPGPCSPQAVNTRADFVGTGRYSLGAGGRSESGNMVAYVIDHREGACNRGTRDEYSITVRTGLEIGRGDIVFATAGEIDCGNLQIHEAPARLFGNGSPCPARRRGRASVVALIRTRSRALPASPTGWRMGRVGRRRRVQRRGPPGENAGCGGPGRGHLHGHVERCGRPACAWRRASTSSSRRSAATRRSTARSTCRGSARPARGRFSQRGAPPGLRRGVFSGARTCQAHAVGAWRPRGGRHAEDHHVPDLRRPGRAGREILRLDLSQLEDQGSRALPGGHAGSGGQRHDRHLRARRAGVRCAQRRRALQDERRRVAVRELRHPARNRHLLAEAGRRWRRKSSGWLVDRFGMSWQVAPESGPAREHRDRRRPGG